MRPGLPAGASSPYRVAMVCLGNICRSPTAEVVLNAMLEDAGVTDVLVESCGTGGWHVGEQMDSRTARVLTAAGYDASRHRARQFGPSWADHDLILTMDASNHADVLTQLPEDRRDRVLLFRTFDPWYGGPAGFDAVLAIVERTCAALTEALALPRQV